MTQEIKLHICASCYFWKTMDSPHPGETGSCFYNPPFTHEVMRPNPIAGGLRIDTVSSRPITKKDDFCHGHKSNLEV